eukprot:1257099-Prymnesium_polylepis.1
MQRACEPTVLAAAGAAKEVKKDGHATHARINGHRVLVQQPCHLTHPLGQALAMASQRGAVAHKLERLPYSRAPGQKMDKRHS